MVCDSTNAMVEGHSGSEAEVRQSLTALIRGLRGRVAVTCFATNVARVEIDRARRARRRPQRRAGRPLAAQPRCCGARVRLSARPAAVPDARTTSDDVPDDNLLMLVTGSQGEPRSALARDRAGHPSAHRARARATP